MTVSYRFRPSQRLHSGADFDRVYRQGRRAGDALFAVNALPNEAGQARLGMSVSYRSVGNAVRRNYLRRLIRDAFRQIAPTLPALDYVVTSRPGAREAPRGAVLDSLGQLIATATRRAQAPAPNR